MITIYKSNTANTVVTTFYERLNYYGLSATTDYWFLIENDLSKKQTIFSGSDISSNVWRYNEFIIDETQLNLVNGFYSYTGSTNSGITNVLEIGKLVISGTNSFNPIYS